MSIDLPISKSKNPTFEHVIDQQPAVKNGKKTVTQHNGEPLVFGTNYCFEIDAYWPSDLIESESVCIVFENDALPDDVPPKDDMKINLCHIPPGNPNNFHTILVSKNAMKAHKNHGDFVGECENKDTDDVVKKLKDAKKKKNMKETEFKEKRKAFNELKKKFENEFKEIKKEFKMPFKDIKSELKGEFKDFKKQQKEYEDYQKKLEELEQRVKDLILELKENYAYDQELKAELKKELKTSLYKEKRALDKHEKQEKHKIDSFNFWNMINILKLRVVCGVIMSVSCVWCVYVYRVCVMWCVCDVCMV